MQFLADEPYCKAKEIRFSKITEFDPVQHQSILTGLESGKVRDGRKVRFGFNNCLDAKPEVRQRCPRHRN